ncbi:Transposase, IS30 family [Piscirickettsia salmonis]|uniref:hypothetical protein n=1 Tax=Piscirickettsia salmonis TaxID=1238 RepID=UPI0018ACD7A4|nr:hypothetical protein [Piscirickettsia salmonis]QGP54040.1 Transposase, IS30 family [Piscirickettsia salmonis]QGP60063.1 Transposase, IS30 family [Piscirickettsia salmonis]QGP63616.1 Transposase, IS30 family [Piscirickettsia salmonis]
MLSTPWLAASGKPYKKKVKSGDKTKIPNRVGIEQRPAIADEKTEFGHFEIDTIVGRDHKSYLLTLVDKANKMCCIRKMANKCAETVVETFRSIVASIAKGLIPRSLLRKKTKRITTRRGNFPKYLVACCEDR